MEAIERAFQGSDFFEQIRPELLKHRGLFLGKDDTGKQKIKYVVLDCNFYRLGVLLSKLKEDKTFIDSIQDEFQANSLKRVFTNAQFFDGSPVSGGYCYPPTPPSACKQNFYEGQTIIRGTLHSQESVYAFLGTKNAHKYRHLGQWRGVSKLSFNMALGNPLTNGYENAIGKLLPIITERVKATKKQLGDWYKQDKEGKIIFAIDKVTNSFLIVVYEDKNVGDGIGIEDVMDNLIAIGIDNAVMGDGGSSPTLYIDGNTIVEPSGYKNRSIPIGLYFQLIHFSTIANQANSTFLSKTESWSILITNTDVITNINASIKLTNSHVELEITSLGTYGNPVKILSDELGIPMPITLVSNSTDLLKESIFSWQNDNITIELTFQLQVLNRNDSGTLVGNMELRSIPPPTDTDISAIPIPIEKITFAINWKLQYN